jgi:hypothetical protein
MAEASKRTNAEPLDLFDITDHLDRAYFLMDAAHMASCALMKDQRDAMSEVIAAALEVLGAARNKLAIEAARKSDEVDNG